MDCDLGMYVAACFKHFHRWPGSAQASQPLSWQQRLQLLAGTAKACTAHMHQYIQDHTSTYAPFQDDAICCRPKVGAGRSSNPCPVRGHLTPQPGYGAGLPAAHAVAVVLVIYRWSIYISLALSKFSSVHCAPLHMATDTARSTILVADRGMWKFRASGQWSAPFAAQEPVFLACRGTAAELARDSKCQLPDMVLCFLAQRNG